MRSPFNLATLFEAVADALPDREAVVSGSRRLTYAALDERANRLANALTDRGVAPGDWIGLDLTNGTEYLEAMLAAFKLRVLPANLNYRYRAGELAYVLADADVASVIHDAEFSETVVEAIAASGVDAFTVERGASYEATLASASPQRPDATERSGDDHYVLYTGGTTGPPKGVLWRHEDIFFGALGGGARDGVPATSVDEVVDRAISGPVRRTLPASPFMHGTGHWMALSTFFAGGTVIIAESAGLEADALLDLVARENVTFAVIVGDAFARPLVDALERNSTRDLSSLSALMSGGAILSPSVKNALGALLPTTMIVDGFGASETGGQGQMVAAPHDSGPPRFRVNDETTVLDDSGAPVAPGSGVVGRLARRGRIPLGYHGDPDKAAATFPVIDGVRWAVPGDLATIEDDGTIMVFGRGSVSINTGGEKVHPEEVEGVLKSHPAIFDALVVGLPDERWGEQVTAVIEVRPGHEAPSAAEVADHCRQRLAAYKAPKAAVIVDQIVRSPSGKPDYRWAKTEAARLVAAGGRG